jgi:4-amino-4-deoxy-L-arabinose transferase-like glycosyltransferase
MKNTLESGMTDIKEKKWKTEKFDRKDLFYIGLLVFVGIIIYFTHLGTMILWDTDEALYAQIAREMYISGDYLTTQWNQTPWFCHPPLCFWMNALFAHFLGWSEVAARLPSALFGLFNVILVYFFGRMLFNRKAGFYSGIIFVITLQNWLQSRLAILDTPFVFFITLSVFFFVIGLKYSDNRWFTGFWVSSALSVLVKGPVGLILALLYVLIFIFVTGRWNLLKPLILSPGLVFFIMLSVPWFWGMINVYREPFVELVFNYFFLNRIVDPVMEQGGSAWYYVPFLLAGFLPWTPFIPMIGKIVYQNREDYRIRFLMLWILLTFIIFTISATKRPNYLMFIYPALSLTLGWILNEVFCQNKYNRIAKWTFLFSAVSALIIIAAFSWAAGYYYPEYLKLYISRMIPLFTLIVISGIAILILAFKNLKTCILYFNHFINCSLHGFNFVYSACRNHSS